MNIRTAITVAAVLAAAARCSSQLRSNLQERMSLEGGTALEEEVGTLLKEVLTGPLQRHNISLMVEEEVEDILRLDSLLRDVPSPTTLLRVPGEGGALVDDFDLLHGVLVAVAHSNFWWPLWKPLSNWFPLAIVLLMLTKSCAVQDILEEAPLLQKSSSVVVFCPFIPKGSQQKISFKVFTWKPYVSGHQLESLGVWDRSSFPSWNSLFVDRFQDFSRKTFTISYSHTDEPVLYRNPDGSLDGTNYRIMKALSHWLHFDISYQEHENNSWEGMRDMVRTGKSDVMINYVTLTLDRTREFDVSIPYQSEGFGMILKVPPPLPLWRNVYYPYSWEVWACVVVSVVACTLFLHMLSFDEERSLMANGMLIAQSLLSHPIPEHPENWRQRWFLCLWDMMAWLLNLCYTCNLIAFLTVPVYPTVIQTAQELADSRYRLCMLDYGEFVDEALHESTHVTLSALGRKLDMVPMRPDLEHWGQEGCVERVLANTHAHLETYYFVNILYHNMGHGASIYPLKEQIYVGNLAFLFRKYTPWKGKFNNGMRRLIEAGLVAKFYKDILSNYENKKDKVSLGGVSPGRTNRKGVSPGVPKESITAPKLLTIAHLQGPFMLLLVGMAAGTLILLGEVVLGTHRGRSPPSQGDGL
ncbi:ionotropic receptor 21a-like [Macrobrachium rosenbergii]|uniref:ionotropic receptor 21a-like n=1 Tax=Macrobrachium rosenbergii TaxID=79674 RepID=UPI0034D52234